MAIIIRIENFSSKDELCNLLRVVDGIAPYLAPNWDSIDEVLAFFFETSEEFIELNISMKDMADANDVHVLKQILKSISEKFPRKGSITIQD